MSKKLFRSMFLVAVAVCVATLALMLGFSYRYYNTAQQNRLELGLSLAAAGVEDSGLSYFEDVSLSDSRLTWVDSDGSVLYDTGSNADTMENHAEREEIAEAFATGTGESSRYSTTLLEQTVYRAVLLNDGTVLRISAARQTVLAMLLSSFWQILAVLLLAMFLSFALANRVAQRAVRPLNEIDLDHPLENDTYDELVPMLHRLEEQHRKIRKQTEELAVRKSEFYAVIRNMNEGLILLDSRNCVLSINPAAEAFFQTEGDVSGQEFVTVERSLTIDSAIEKAKAQGKGEVQISRNGREYKVNVSRIVSEEKTLGVVILVFDVTEQVISERSRREFTANVSHELKTPLQSIIGSAELMRNGMVASEDIPRFSDRIYTQAKRLLALIEDTIRLSQLDEGTPLQPETVNFSDVANEVLDVLRPVAEEKGVTLTLSVGDISVRTIRQLLYEVLYNLCDNAVKYNTDGGSVTVSCESASDEVRFTVADTGIGIPDEDKARVFERFYRVDKSRTGAARGTGLGLSIVKHAVQTMGGQVSLQSTFGKGTTVTVVLPK